MKKNWRNIGIPRFVLLAINLSACAPLPTQESQNDNAAISHSPAQEDETLAGKPETTKPDAAKFDAVKPEAVKPDAIFFLPPADQPLPAEITQSLKEILAGLRDRKNILFTLEAWPLAAGSREVNIGLARQAVTRLRNKLVAMGVHSYRIKISIRGDQSANTPDDSQSTPEKQRVDLFLSALTS
ncbi:MAG: hypothetical protein FWG81_11570 [Betaproteobacteria bacterium]|nr:hypothetical protein [Betaproteobacteria bacterium]